MARHERLFFAMMGVLVASMPFLVACLLWRAMLDHIWLIVPAWAVAASASYRFADKLSAWLVSET